MECPLLVFKGHCLSPEGVKQLSSHQLCSSCSGAIQHLLHRLSIMLQWALHPSACDDRPQSSHDHVHACNGVLAGPTHALCIAFMLLCSIHSA